VAYAAIFLGVMLPMPRGILPSIADRVAARRSSKNGAQRADGPRAKMPEAVT
jgi:hypothetical protein